MISDLLACRNLFGGWHMLPIWSLHAILFLWSLHCCTPAFRKLDRRITCKRHLGNMDFHSMPGVVHVALEVPEWSHVLWLCLPGCVPSSYDHMAVARGKGYCHFPKAPDR